MAHCDNWPWNQSIVKIVLSLWKGGLYENGCPNTYELDCRSPHIFDCQKRYLIGFSLFPVGRLCHSHCMFWQHAYVDILMHSLRDCTEVYTFWNNAVDTVSKWMSTKLLIDPALCCLFDDSQFPNRKTWFRLTTGCTANTSFYFNAIQKSLKNFHISSKFIP